MMKQIKVIPILLGALLLLGSCVKEELPGTGSVAENEPTLMKFSLSASFLNDEHSTRAALPTAEENKFKDIRVFVFKANGDVVTNYKEIYPTARENPKLTIHTYSGNKRTIYIVANAVDALDVRLAGVKTKTELEAMQTNAVEFANGLSGKPLLMIGSKTLDIAAGTTDLTKNEADKIAMTFMAAKLTLKVIDATPASHSVTILGWDIENAPQNTFVTPHATDANAGKEGEESAWLSTAGSLMKFDSETEDPGTGKKTALLTQYIFENRRGGRVLRPLPTDKYPGMSLTDKNDKGKAWFAPRRASCIVIHAIHTGGGMSKTVEARIFFGIDNHSDYNIVRGSDYRFTVTVKGINDINIDTNIEAANGAFAVHASAPLDKIDAHPDFRPVMISGVDGTASIEILDGQGRSHDDPSFDATWVKVSPLNLMYHQVRQAAPNDEWQQAGEVGSFVRAKYIPHKSVRAALAGKGGWNTVPVGKDDDDIMTFADATYRMCYKITEIPFAVGTVTNKTLCIYTDEFMEDGGTRTAQIKITFRKTQSVADEEHLFTIIQNGYLTAFDATHPDAGLAVFNANHTPSDVKKMFVVEQYEEVGMMMNPGIDPSVQRRNNMQWGFTDVGVPSNSFRNGYLMTAQVVYKDVIVIDNRPTGFGTGTDSYMDMYGNYAPHSGSGVIPNYTGATSAPYYYPVATDVIYHPIFKSSASRYCHEKNRDINGDGCIDESETKWYLPSFDEMNMIVSLSDIKLPNFTYHCSTRLSANKIYVFDVTGDATRVANPSNTWFVRCVREF